MILIKRLDECLQLLIDTDRLPEAAFFARTYKPSEMNRIVELWREELKKTNLKAAQALADPIQYENLFHCYKDSLQAEKFLENENASLLPATTYSKIVVSYRENIFFNTCDEKFYQNVPKIVPESF